MEVWLIISHQHRFAFIKTRKTAGTSVEIALSPFLGPDDVSTRDSPEDESMRFAWGGSPPQNYRISRANWGIRGWTKWILRRPELAFASHTSLAGLKRYTNDVFGEYFIFSIDRNPWDLAVSAYSWAYKASADPPSFGQFLFSEAIHKYSNWRLYTLSDQVAVDYLIRYEDLENGLRHVGERLGLSIGELPRAKSDVRRDDRPYQDWYDDDAMRMRVAEVFRKEIAHFGWTFDDLS